MSMESLKNFAAWAWLPALIIAWPTLTNAQVPVTDSGTPVATVATSAEEIPLLSAADLEILIGPVALYPDDLLAIVLPASTYPLQLVQAERFLQDLKNDPELKPDESWDDSIIALINYPEVVELLTKDLDKTWRLGEAVVAQQSDVIAAIESFRDQAYAAGNLQTDTHQTVSQNDGVIEITPIEEDVIYVPYYEPERVVVYQPTPAYYYYPRAYPVYNYPYAYGHSFSHGFFWGVTTAFTVGWFSDSLHVYHHSYYGHPYYGYSYGHNYWYRQPSIYAHNNYYYNSHNYYSSGNRYGHGDYWRPHSGSTVSPYDQRVTRSRHYPGTKSGGGSVGNNSGASQEVRSNASRQSNNRSRDVKFRQRSATVSNQSSSIKPTQTRKTAANQLASRESVSGSVIAKQERSGIKFRERTTVAPQQLAANKSSQSSRSSQPSRSSSQQPRSSQPTRSSSQQPRSSQPTHSSSQQPRSSQPTRSSSQQPRSSQSSRPSSQPSRSSQPSQSSSQSQKSQQSRSSKSGSNKVASTSAGRSQKRSGNRR